MGKPIRKKPTEPATRASMTTKREIWLSVEEIERACRHWVQAMYGDALPNKSAVEQAVVRFDLDFGHDGGTFNGANVIIEDAVKILAKEEPKPEPPA